MYFKFGSQTQSGLWINLDENEYFILQEKKLQFNFRVLMKGTELNKRLVKGDQEALPPVETHIVAVADTREAIDQHWNWLAENVVVICTFFDRSSVREELELWKFLTMKLNSLAEEAVEKNDKKPRSLCDTPEQNSDEDKSVPENAADGKEEPGPELDTEEVGKVKQQYNSAFEMVANTLRQGFHYARHEKDSPDRSRTTNSELTIKPHRRGPKESTSKEDVGKSLSLTSPLPVYRRTTGVQTARSALTSSGGGESSEDDDWVLIKEESSDSPSSREDDEDLPIGGSGLRKKKKTRSEVLKLKRLLDSGGAGIPKAGSLPPKGLGRAVRHAAPRKISVQQPGLQERELFKDWAELFPDQPPDHIIAGKCCFPFLGAGGGCAETNYIYLFFFLL